MTRRELRKTLKRDAREWVREVWQASAGAAAELEALSPLTAVLGTRLVEDYAASKKRADSELQRALRIVIVAGYGARIVLVDPTNQPALRPGSFHLGQRADAEKLAGDAAAVGRLLDDVRTIAGDRWDSVMTLPPEVWKCFVVTALQKLQHQLSTDTLSWQELGRERIETILGSATSSAASTRRSAPNRSCGISTPSPNRWRTTRTTGTTRATRTMLRRTRRPTTPSSSPPRTASGG